MMAASVVRTGIAGKSIDSTPAIPSSQHSSSMHDPFSVSPKSSSSGPSSITSNSSEVVNKYEDLGGLSRPNDQISYITPAGKKLAVSSVQGPAASRVPSSTSTLHEDETDIALSQLKELEVAIEVRKVTRVDGRKTRWIEYRREKKKLSPKRKLKSRGQLNAVKVVHKKRNLKGIKPIKKLVKISDENHSLKNAKIKPKKELTSIKSEELPKLSNNNNIDNTNNNNIKKNKKIEPNMKVEVGGPVINSLGTNNVLETMKQQFLQGTVDVPEHTSNGIKDKPVRKFSKTTNGVTSNLVNNEPFKRKPGRPKKGDSKAGAAKIAIPAATIKAEEPPALSQSPDTASVPDVNASTENGGAKKLDLSQSTADFYSRRNFLTKGLREVRKSESGSESGGSSPVKDGSPSTLSPSPHTALSPIPSLNPMAKELSNSSASFKSLKCPLISAAAKALVSGMKKPKITNDLVSRKKKIMKKISKKENINIINETNGHEPLSNGSSEKHLGFNKFAGKPQFKKRGRGRPKAQRMEEPVKWMKTTSTVIVDVHNTMNGEPQTVIPVQNPMLRKKKSPPKSFKLLPPKPAVKYSISELSEIEEKSSDCKNTLDSNIGSNKQNETLSPVVEIVSSSSLSSRSSSPSSTSKKLANTQSASNISKIPETGKSDSTKINFDTNMNDKSAKEIDVPEVSPLNCPTIKTKSNSSDTVIEVKDSVQHLNDNKSSSNNQVPNNKSQKGKDLKLGGAKKPGSITTKSLTNEITKKPNSSDAKRQTTIQSYMKVYSPNLSDENSPKPSHQTKNSEVKLDDPIKIEDDKSDQKDLLKTPSTFSLTTPPNSESKISDSKIISTESPKSISSKTPKKTPDKVKNKSLSAVIQKLYSPSPKKKSIELKQTTETLVEDSTVTFEKSSTKNSCDSLPAAVENEDTKSEEVKDNKESQIQNEKQVEPMQTEDKKSPKSVGNNNNNDNLNNNNNSVDKVATAAKPKEKVPRFLKQLFQDEGVQNMLRSVNEEPSPNIEGASALESGSHKLRPKRANESYISDSPEPDDSLFINNSKRKRRGTEVDNLFLDEGTLNLLTSIDAGSRRPSLVDDTASDTSHASSSKSLSMPAAKSAKIQPEFQTIDTLKRKLPTNAGVSTVVGANATVGKVLQLPEAKKPKLDIITPNSEPSPTSLEVTNIEKLSSENLEKMEAPKVKKKPGRPSLPMPFKQKTKAQVVFQLKRQLYNLGIANDNLTIAQMKELIAKTKLEKNYNGKPVTQVKLKTDEQQEKLPIKLDQSILPTTVNNINNNSNTNNINNDITPKLVKVSKPSTPDGIRTYSSSPGPTNASTLIRKPRPPHLTGSGDRVPIKYPTSSTSSVTSRKSSISSGSQHTEITSLVRSLEPPNARDHRGRRGPGEGIRQSQRSSVRQSEGNHHFRDISLRRFNNFMQIILTPSTTKMKNSLNSRVLRELCEALSTLRRDENVRMVLLTATGSTFCQGIDLTSLQHPNHDTRKKNAENLARGIKDFLRALVQFPKMIVAGVNGSAMGLGVTMLPLFDMVYATDKAEFFLPYAKLGQVPEGGATYTFPTYYGKLQSNKLFLGQKITASQAQQMGLVSESIWPATFQEELLPKVALLATQSAVSMEGTKALMNHHIITKLELSVESECRILLQQWTSQNFSNLCKRFLDSSEVQLQKPVNLPL